MLHNLWMTPLCFTRCIKISVTGRNGGFALFLRQPVRETRDRCTSGSLIYRCPEQTDRETCCEFFTGRSFSPILPLPPRPPCYTPFRNSYKRRNTSNLDSRLKNWKTISPWFSSASRNTRWLNGAQQDVVSAVRRAFTLSSILASHWVQHSRNLSQRELQPPATLSSIDESFGGPWTQRYHDINHSVKGKCDSSPLSSLPFFPSLPFSLFVFHPLENFDSPKTPLNRSLPIRLGEWTEKQFNNYGVANSFNH